MFNAKMFLAGSLFCLLSAPAMAATYTISQTGDTNDYSTYSLDFNHQHYDGRFYPLAGLDASNAITVSQGDIINSTVTFNNLFTVPASMLHTDFLHYFFGSPFPGENTGVTGTFTFYNGATPVLTHTYGSTTSDQLASYAALFPPNNAAFSFTSFTNNFVIDTLATSATLDHSALSYALVSAGTVPEPASWVMLIGGFGAIGAAMRRRPRRTTVSFA